MPRIRFATALICLLNVSGFALADDHALYQKLASIQVLMSKTVQAELKVTEAQHTSLNDHASVYNGTADALVKMRSDGKLTDEQFRSKLAEAQDQLRKGVMTVLTPAQIDRLGQISLQKIGVPAVFDENLARRLGISQAQTKILTDAWNQLGKDVAEVERQAREPIVDKYRKMDPKTDAEKEAAKQGFEKEMADANLKIQPDLIRLKKSFEDLVAKTLTDGQKKDWSNLKGTPFKG